MTYSEFIKEIMPYAEEKYAVFHRGLTPTKYSILGIRVPIMRKIAQKYKNQVSEILSFPNEYFEVVFIKLTVVSLLPFESFIQYIEKCVELIDNWAHCDCFKAKCISKHKEEFLPILDKLFKNTGEFYQRYALVVLLSEYLEEKYLTLIMNYIRRADTEKYYVHMAAAWLVAEILVKYFDFGVSLLHNGVLKVNTHNKAIQKAIESYRLTESQKEYLRSLKINNKKI